MQNEFNSVNIIIKSFSVYKDLQISSLSVLHVLGKYRHWVQLYECSIR